VEDEWGWAVASESLRYPAAFDGHNDTILGLIETGLSFFARPDEGHIDFPRAFAGGLGGGLFAIFVPEPPGNDHLTKDGRMSIQYAQSVALTTLGRLLQLPAGAPGRLKIVHTAAAIRRCLDEGVFAVVLHLEGAEPLDPDGYALEAFYAAGVRSVGLTHSRPNQFATGVPRRSFPGSPDIGPGLTDVGKALVRQLNQRHIVIDLSHINERGFWDVAAITDAPLVASHSNAHALCQSPRNLTDRQLGAIRERRGIVGLNFAVSFLREDGARNSDTPMTRMVQHIDYMVERMGVDCVGLGSDYDGTLIPSAIGDVTGLPEFVRTLERAGYSASELRKLLQENWLRVLRETWTN